MVDMEAARRAAKRLGAELRADAARIGEILSAEQCPGCPAGGTYVPDPTDAAVDGCSVHSTASYNARSRGPQMGGGNLPLED